MVAFSPGEGEGEITGVRFGKGFTEQAQGRFWERSLKPDGKVPDPIQFTLWKKRWDENIADKKTHT